ncbi:MAG TPA: galactokinase family protein [Tepidisphaeraceae bacterium]|jgi:galactokinase
MSQRAPDPDSLLRQCEAALGGGCRASWRLWVPGRIEFLGKHTDYAGGRSLVCAIDRGFHAALAPRPDSVFRIIDVSGKASAEFTLAADLAPRPGDWTNYPITVARRIARNFPGTLRGADLAFASTLPLAAGLSSSSALVVLTFLALDATNDLHRRPEYTLNINSTEDLAGYLGAVENGQTFGTLQSDSGVGTFGGSQDHTAILCAKENTLGQYSFCPVIHERDVPMPSDHVFAIAVSGVVAEKTGAALQLYNRASQLVSNILSIWRTTTGRADSTLAAAVRSAPDAPDQIREMLRRRPIAQSEMLLHRFDQFVQESEYIIPAAGDALLSGDLAALQDLVTRSQSLAERLLKNQVPETIALARLAKECGATAASAFGAGFGGSVWALVRHDSADRFLGAWQCKYLAEFRQHAPHASFFLTPAGPPARCTAASASS